MRIDEQEKVSSIMIWPNTGLNYLHNVVWVTEKFVLLFRITE